MLLSKHKRKHDGSQGALAKVKRRFSGWFKWFKDHLLIREVILSMQPWPDRVLYAVKNEPPVEYSTSLITNTL